MSPENDLIATQTIDDVTRCTSIPGPDEVAAKSRRIFEIESPASFSTASFRGQHQMLGVLSEAFA